ncbi:MAG: 2-hydroxyacyl-CoA dehydratase family protein [Pseudomonadota bacterium]
METLKKLRSILESRHDSANSWKKEKDQKVIGEFCKYVPEEMIHATGALPVFIMGEMDSFGDVNRYLQENTCPYIRSCFACGISGDYDYMDGLVVTHACDLMSKMHDFWRNRTNVPSIFLLDFPHKANESSLIFFRQVLDRFKEYLEETTGAKITDEALSESIRLYNEYRQVLKRIYDLRLSNPRLVSGIETLTALLASMLMRKEEAFVLLQKFIEEVKARTGPPPEGVPIVVTGTDVTSLDLFGFLEDCGALIVSDDLCTGSRLFWHPVDEAEAPLDALAKRYLFNIPCSRTYPSEERYDHIISLCRDYQAKGVIMPVMDFCDNHKFDAPFVLDKLNENGIQALTVQMDFTKGGLEQIRPNVEAFLEIINERSKS